MTRTTALQLSSPVLFQALLLLFYFSSNASDFIRTARAKGLPEALVIEGVVLIVLANALADAVQSRLDPRVRLRA